MPAKSTTFEPVFSQNAMKTNFALAFLILIWISSCKEINDVSINDVDAPVEIDFSVNSPDSTGEKEVVIDALSNSDFMTNKSKIQSLEVSRMTYRVTSIGPLSSDSLLIGKFDWFNPTTNTYQELSSLTNKKFQLDLPFDLPLQQSILNQMTEQFKTAPYQSKLRFKASMSKKPSDFTLSVKVFLKLKVKL